MYSTRAAAMNTWEETMYPLYRASLYRRTLKASPLMVEDKAEVVAFLAARAIHTVNLRGLLSDNGFNSPRNRGTFYGYRNERGELEGVALIGHATLIEARTEEAIEAFAQVAKQQQQQNLHMVLGEEETIRSFWRSYEAGGQTLRHTCREVLLEKSWPVVALEPIEGLRVATLADLDLIIPVQAEMAQAESGVSPLAMDDAGFRTRCAARIARGRVWVWIQDGRLIFKADIVSETPETIYLEGIYVAPEVRGNNYGARCLSQLDQMLLMKTRSICLLVNADNTAAQALYKKSGYKFRDNYDTLFLQKRDA